MADTIATSPERAARDFEWLQAYARHAASPTAAPAPDLRLLADDAPEAASSGAGAIKRATIGRDCNGSPVVLVSLADTRTGAPAASLRRPRALAPPIAVAFRVVLWFGSHPEATGRLTADPQTAWLLTNSRTGAAGRDRCLRAALAVYDLSHATSGLEMTLEAYCNALTMALAAAEDHFATLSRRHAGRPLRAA